MEDFEKKKKKTKFLEKPLYPGGAKALREFVNAHLQYPQDAMDQHVEGVVTVAYQVNDVLEAMSSDIGTRFTSLRVDGGASANNLLMEMQANISGLSVERPVCLETTALGAAYLAGLAVGFWKDFDELRANAAGGRTFIPRIEKEERKEKIAGWHRAVERSFKWA